MCRALFLSLAAICGLAVSAKASVTYEYVTDAVVNANGGTIASTNGGTINATAGQSISVNLYLQETITNGSPSPLTSDGGLYGAGVTLIKTGGSGGSLINASAAQFTSATAYNGVAWETSGTSPSTGMVTTQGLRANVNTSPTGIQLTNGLILIGTETIVAQAGLTTFQLQTGTSSPIGPGNTITYGNGNYDLDSTNNATNGGGATYFGAGDTANLPGGGFYTFSVNVAAVPEPSSVMLTGLAFAGLAFGAYRRRAKNAAADAVSVA